MVAKTLQRHADFDAAQAADSSSGDAADDESDKNTELSLSSRPRKRQKKSTGAASRDEDSEVLI